MRVLIAEDDLPIRELLKEALLDDGHEVVSAADGQYALERWAKDGPFDALITDVRMPRLTGDELAVRLRREQPRLPIVVVSGYQPSSMQRRLGALGGPLTILDKPVLMVTVVRAIEQLASPARLLVPGEYRPVSRVGSNNH